MGCKRGSLCLEDVLADNVRAETRVVGERAWLVELVDALRVSALDESQLLRGERDDVAH